MKNNLYIRILGAIVFIALLFFGFRTASQKPLWNDEIYSQIASVETLSYSEILLGRVNEGNACPLFYLTQKAVGDIMGYKTPLEWRVKAKVWDFDRYEDRIVLRIVPVLFTALTIWLIFSYFANFYSLATAFFSLLLSLSTAMFLQYGVEARPYALWIFLTTVQVFIFLRLIESSHNRNNLLRWLSVIHILLSFTVILSLAQVALICSLLWVYGERSEREWRRYVFLFIMPALIAITFWLVSPKYPFGLVFTVDQYLRANISRDRFYLFWLFVLALSVYGIQQKAKRFNVISNEILKGLPAFAIFCGAVAAACSLLVIFKIKQGPEVQFPVSEKYFIFLAPVGVITLTSLVDAMVRAIRPYLLKICVIGFVLGMVVPRAFKVIKSLLKQYPNLF